MTETYISVDVEAGGPTTDYNLCSIGAVDCSDLNNQFYIELAPMTDLCKPDAIAVGGFSLESMKENGTRPDAAMRGFRMWLSQFNKPIMVGFGSFDWQFINYYFWKYNDDLDYPNPFGISYIDIKILYMGFKGVPYRKTVKRKMEGKYLSTKRHTHRADQDAVEQAVVFNNIMKELIGE